MKRERPQETTPTTAGVLRTVMLAGSCAAILTACAPASGGPEESESPASTESTQASTGEEVSTMNTPDETTVGESLELLRSVLEETAAGVAPGRTLELFREIGPTECVDPANRGLGTHYVTLSYNLPAEDTEHPTLLQSIAAAWRARGFELATDRLEDPQPELLAGHRGYALRALAVPGSGRINLAGDTPCLPLSSRSS